MDTKKLIEQIAGLLSWYGEDCAIRGYDDAKKEKAADQILSLLQPLIDQAKAEGRREEQKRIFKEFEERYEVIQHFGKPSPYITFKIRREEWQALKG